MFRSILAAIFLLSGTAYGQEFAERTHGAAWYDECHVIDAKKGWQRIVVPDLTPTNLYVISPNHSPSPDILERFDHPYLWSVDDARYDRVGTLGHQGAAEEALAPYSDYKYDSEFPFGALLFRMNNPRRTFETAIAASVEELPVRQNESYWENLFLLPLRQGGNFLFLPSNTGDWIELRINDTLLQDNGGSMIVCID